MKNFRVPHVYVMIFILLLFVALLTYVLPAGAYERYTDETSGRTQVVAGSYTVTESSPVSPLGVLQAIPQGMTAAGSIIFFVFVIGGAFGVINATGVIELGIHQSMQRLQKAALWLIPALMILFSIMGGFLGMLESVVAFVPVCVLLARAMGYDALTGFAILTVGNVVGFTAGPMNMWGTGVAQSIAQLPIFSAIGTRLIIHGLFLLIGILYVLRYARRVKRDPHQSLVYELEVRHREKQEKKKKEEPLPSAQFTRRKKLVLLLVILGVVTLLAVTIALQWTEGYQVAGLLLLIAIVTGLADGQSPNDIADHFVAGAQEVTMGALVVGLARAILVVMEEGNIVDTLLYMGTNLLGHFSPVFAVLLMFLFQFLFNFIVYSGSVQAATTMPLMVPLGDLIGLTRQSAVMAFQLGDGLSSLLWPTAGPLMAGLSIAEIPYLKWLRWIAPLLGIFIALAVAILAFCALLPLGPF